MMKLDFGPILVALAASGLAGCGGSGDLADLESYAAQIRSRPKGAITPLPEVKLAEPFVLRAGDVRNPFGTVDIDEASIAGGKSGPLPDLNRAKEELESYALDSLRMVGTLTREKSLRALVKTPEGTVHLVRTGNYAGKNYGKVVSVSEDRIDLVELIDEGSNGWRERPASIVLAH